MTFVGFPTSSFSLSRWLWSVCVILRGSRRWWTRRNLNHNIRWHLAAISSFRLTSQSSPPENDQLLRIVRWRRGKKSSNRSGKISEIAINKCSGVTYSKSLYSLHLTHLPTVSIPRHTDHESMNAFNASARAHTHGAVGRKKEVEESTNVNLLFRSFALASHCHSVFNLKKNIMNRVAMFAVSSRLLVLHLDVCLWSMCAARNKIFVCNIKFSYSFVLSRERLIFANV